VNIHTLAFKDYCDYLNGRWSDLRERVGRLADGPTIENDFVRLSADFTRLFSAGGARSWCSRVFPRALGYQEDSCGL
jgi:hypothetical protein